MKRTSKQAKAFLKKQTKKQARNKQKNNKTSPPKWPTGPNKRTTYPT